MNMKVLRKIREMTACNLSSCISEFYRRKLFQSITLQYVFFFFFFFFFVYRQDFPFTVIPVMNSGIWRAKPSDLHFYSKTRDFV